MFVQDRPSGTPKETTPSMPEPFQPADSALSAVDQLFLQRLQDSCVVRPAEVEILRACWQAERKFGEGLVLFLERTGILRPDATLQLCDQGGSSASSSPIQSILSKGGLQKLIRVLLSGRLAEAGELPACETLFGAETLAVEKGGGKCASVAGASTPHSVPQLSSSDWWIGYGLGRYRLTKHLGRGSVSATYCAVDQSSGSLVAVKILDRDHNAGLKDSFLESARSAQRIVHPLILPVVDAGQTNGLVYRVSQFIPEGSIADELRTRGAFPPYEATRIIVEVARALAMLHNSGMAHGNLKPTNIFVTAGAGVRVGDLSSRARTADSVEWMRFPFRVDVAADCRMAVETWHGLLTCRPFAAALSQPMLPEPLMQILQQGMGESGFTSAGELAAALSQAAASIRNSTGIPE